MTRHDATMAYGAIGQIARPAYASLENIYFLKQIGAWTDEVTRVAPAQPAAFPARPSMPAIPADSSFAAILDATLTGR